MAKIPKKRVGKGKIKKLNISAEVEAATEEEAIELIKKKLCFLGLHQRIRSVLDPDSIYMSDMEIQRILRKTGGREHTSITRIILAMQYKAMKKKNRAALADFRRMLYLYENKALPI